MDTGDFTPASSTWGSRTRTFKECSSSMRRGNPQRKLFSSIAESQPSFNRSPMAAPPMKMNRHIEADPYPWPYDGDLRPDNTVVLVIDMQTDFCGKGGYVDM